MISKRRQFLKRAGLTTVGSLLALNRINIYASEAKKTSDPNIPATKPDETASAFQDALKKLLNGKPIVDTDKIIIDLPKTADKKNPVSINIKSSIKQSLRIAILIEQNPMPLAATFDLVEHVDPHLTTRLKLSKTTYVFVLVETAKVFYAAKALVTITTSGCGV